MLLFVHNYVTFPLSSLGILRVGMTRHRLEEILGPPAEKMYIGTLRASTCYWGDGNRSIGIQFDWDYKKESSEEIVAEKWFMPKTRWEEWEETIAEFIEG